MSRVCFVAVLATVILSCHGDSHVSDIRLPPEIVSQGKKHIYYRPDGDETLPCEAKGNPTPLQYEWLRNGEHLDLDRFMSIDGGNLVFRALNSLHEGYYQCKARNQYGTALSNVTFLQRAVMGTFPPTTDHTEYRGTVGHPLQIPCDHFGGVPRPEISWQIVNDVYDYQSVPLALDRRKSIDEDGTLYFAHLTIDDHLDGKVYKCVTRNNELDLHQGGSYSIVEVEDYPGPAPAMSNLHATRNVVGFVGGNVTLKCIFSGSPTPRVTWTDSRGISLPLGRRQELTAYGTELMITDLTKGDEGTYTCLGNQEGGCESDPVQIILQVQAAPQFPEDSRPINVNKTEGEDHTFRCNATGEPQPDIQWFVNGDANFYDPKIAVNGEELTIRNLCKDCGNSGTDLKTVQCNASNIHGYVFASAYLNVLQRTQVIVSPESFTYTTNVAMIIMSCASETDDSTPLTVEWIHRGVALRTGDDSRLDITEDHTIIIDVEGLELQEIADRFSGEYTCLASNGYTSDIGMSQIIVPGYQPTTHTQVRVIPESITYTSDVTMLIISCAYETDDNNTLTVEWRHRGITLHSGDDPRVHIVENLCHTIIIDVGGMELQEISDRFSGEYACVAYNAYTSGTGVSQIIVPTGTSKT